MSEPANHASGEIPYGNIAGFKKFMKQDLTSGLLVFLIALPLCLGISIASGYPPIAGIFTAIIGSLVTTFISNSELTIKGPAAGLIVIAVGCINEFGGAGNPDAYKAALAVGVAAAVLQILFGVFRAGILGEFFPTAAVHGMLAAIGVIILVKQIPFALGVIDPATGRAPSAAPLEMVRQIPHYIAEANPAIAVIGIVSLLIMFLWPSFKNKVGPLKVLPAPMIVLLVAVPMGMGFNLLHEHPYELGGHQYQLSDQYLVNMPDRVFGMFDEITLPNFAALTQPVAWKWVMMFFLIGSLESLLSAKAVDLLDPWKRKTNMDRDIIAVGTANLCAAMVGGLPMISEIVRSKANIDNGARTRFADMWHGIFLLLCVALIPTVLHRIPLAALAAMLVYTGSRLAHPNEFIHVYRIGKEQLAIFLTTLVIVLVEDLLVGVAAGIILKMIIHVANGVPLKSLFKPDLEVEEVSADTTMIIAKQSAVFSNWIPFRRQIEEIGLVQRRNLIIDVSNTQLVDSSVMEKLEEMERNFEQEGLKFEVRGLDSLQPFSENAHATRKRGLARVRRVTVMANHSLQYWLLDEFEKCGITGYTVTSCTGAGRRNITNDSVSENEHVRIEVIATEAVCNAIIDFLRRDIMPDHHVTACVETVDVVRVGDFAPDEELAVSHTH
jgi:MFS superfamily sulfate permease-like transporter